jgi:hypothetical protein
MAGTHEGTCFCGKVAVTVEGEPIAEGFCHCSDCREWSAAPMSTYALWPADQARVEAPTGGLIEFNRVGKATRVSCAACGGAVAARLDAEGLIDVFPTLLRGRPFRPAAHVNYRERVTDMRDGLPKFLDMPAEAGGSGEMHED